MIQERQAEAKVTKPGATLWLTHLDMMEKINAELTFLKIQLMPGHAFLRPETELTTRLCFVDFDGDAAVRALQNGEDATSKVICARYRACLFTCKHFISGVHG